jgi:hypothetical protein
MSIPKTKYIEPYSHLFFSESPNDILDKVKKYLTENNIDWKQESPFELSCVTYPNSCKLYFKARIWVYLNKNTLEFQRLSGGNTNKFYKIWRDIAGVNTDEKEYDDSDMSINIEKLPETLSILLNMLNSTYIESEIQAIISLCNLSKTVLLSTEVLDETIKRISSPLEDVSRCALTILANMSSDKTFAKYIIKTNIISIITDRLDKGEDWENFYNTPHMLREGRRLITNIRHFL